MINHENTVLSESPANIWFAFLSPSMPKKITNLKGRRRDFILRSSSKIGVYPLPGSMLKNSTIRGSEEMVNTKLHAEKEFSSRLWFPKNTITPARVIHHHGSLSAGEGTGTVPSITCP